jgi:hypothetical protein
VFERGFGQVMAWFWWVSAVVLVRLAGLWWGSCVVLVRF